MRSRSGEELHQGLHAHGRRGGSRSRRGRGLRRRRRQRLRGRSHRTRRRHQRRGARLATTTTTAGSTAAGGDLQQDGLAILDGEELLARLLPRGTDGAIVVVGMQERTVVEQVAGGGTGSAVRARLATRLNRRRLRLSRRVRLTRSLLRGSRLGRSRLYRRSRHGGRRRRGRRPKGRRVATRVLRSRTRELGSWPRLRPG